MIDPAIVDRIKGFDKSIEECLDDTKFTNKGAVDMCINDIDNAGEATHCYGSNTQSDDWYIDMLPEDRPYRDNLEDDAYDRYIGAEVLMDVPGAGSRRATVKCPVSNNIGKVVGTHHEKPLMDTREYELEYDDGTHDRYFPNVTAENIYSQIDSEG